MHVGLQGADAAVRQLGYAVKQKMLYIPHISEKRKTFEAVVLCKISQGLLF